MAKLFAAPAVSSLRVSTFKGLDVSMPDDQIALYRAADSLNMIPDASGEVRKRPGIRYDGTLEATFLCERLVEMYPGYLCIGNSDYRYGVKDPHFYVGFFIDGEYESLISLRKKPTVVIYGNKSIVFATKGISPEFDAAVMVCDGETLHVYTDGGIKHVYSKGWSREKWEPDDEYIKAPISMIGCAPEGGGTPHEQINLLSPWVTESFCVTKEGGEHTFYLNGEAEVYFEPDYYGNGDENFKVKVLVPKENNVQIEGNDYKSNQIKWVYRRFHSLDAYYFESNSVYLDKGGFSYAPVGGGWYGNGLLYGLVDGCNIQPTPKEGEDNVQITYRRRDFRESFIAICHCMCGGVYGVGGYKDRLFIGGSDLGVGKNVVYYSEMDQPLYIGALNYIHSEQGSEILALNGTGKSLVILTDRGIALVTGQASVGNEDSFVTDSIYTISATIPAPKPIGYNNTAIFGGEIVYLSEDGVIAIAAKDNYDERYAEHRSALINRKMLADRPQKILSYGRYLLVFCEGGYCWLLDENQPSNAGDRPYSSHQYEGFRMSGFECDCAFVEDGILKIAREVTWQIDPVNDLNRFPRIGIYKWLEGDECKDYSDEVVTEVEYIDEEKVTSKFLKINAFWETPWIYGSNFYRKKRFSRLALLLGEADLGDYQIKVEGKKNDETEWSTIWDYDGTFCTFDYGRVNYGLFTYRTTHACPDLVRKIKIKKALRFKLRFSNDKINQSFVLREFGLDYVLGG